MMTTKAFPPGTFGYVYRVDCAEEGWSYIGQTTRLSREDTDNYLSSGFYVRDYLARRGPGGLTKRILATASTQLELHFLEILHLAEARSAGVMVANGDWGGPQAFATVQKEFRDEFPEVTFFGMSPSEFHRLIASNRERVQLVIERSSDIDTDSFYADYELTLRQVMDLTSACPKCGAGGGEVCRTNAASLTKPHNPTVNHRGRPAQERSSNEAQ